MKSTSDIRRSAPCLRPLATSEAKSARKAFRKVVAGVEKGGGRRGIPSRKTHSTQKFGREKLFNTGDNENREPQRC